jgi:hypothetical protein
MNFAYGWCSVTPLGDFDPDLGGHFVLWDFKLAVRFPPGSTILIPSALFTHSNASIQKNEKRYSIVQYAAGGLFRWAKRGFMTEKAWLRRRQAAKSALQGHEEKEEQPNRCEVLELFTTLDELMRGRGGGSSI